MLQRLLLLFCFIISQNVCVSTAITVTVNSTVGQVIGRDMDYFEMFLSIPYGVVDEKNPFGNAAPHPPFNSPHNGTFDSGPVCPQFDEGTIKGSIQCLVLNVYRSKVTTPGKTLPVMVYIHGGAFARGNSRYVTYSPSFLLRHDVVFVSMNYRVGPYGHLCLPNTEYSNQAFKDQNLALKWVKNNIASFGGDINNIMLFGHSSGSISVHYHLLFNKELSVNKIILQSGVAVTPLVNEMTETLVKDVGLDVENTSSEYFIKTISTIDTNTIINITKFYDFRPCVDGEFVTKKIPNLRNLKNLKLVIGVTAKEMLYTYPTQDKIDKFNFTTELGKAFSVSKMADLTDAIDVIKRFYLNETKVNVIDFASDIDFNYPTQRTINYYVSNNSTVYSYLFSYDGGRNFLKLRDNITSAGATHGDELGYLFDMPRYEMMLKENSTPSDDVIVNRISEMWTNFAKYGDPTPMTSSLVSVKWIPVTAGAKPYLQIDEHLELHNHIFAKRMAFWDVFYVKYGKFAKGFSLGEKYFRNNACVVDLSKLFLFMYLPNKDYAPIGSKALPYVTGVLNPEATLRILGMNLRSAARRFKCQYPSETRELILESLV